MRTLSWKWLSETNSQPPGCRTHPGGFRKKEKIVTGESTMFYNLPDEIKDTAIREACEQYGVEDFFDLTPAQRREVYHAAVAPQFAIP